MNRIIGHSCGLTVKISGTLMMLVLLILMALPLNASAADAYEIGTLYDSSAESPVAGTPTPACTPGLSWTTVANYFVDIQSPAVGTDGNFLYSAGGLSGTAQAAARRYDPAANAWSPIADMPVGVYAARGVFAPNTNTFYVFGGLINGSTAVAHVQRYNAATRTWNFGTPMPASRYLPNVAFDPSSGKIIVQGGFDAGFLVNTTTWAYDPVSNTWDTSRAPSPVPMAGSGTGVIGEFMYMVGSWNAAMGSNVNLRYDLVDDSWTSRAPLPTNIYMPAAGIFNNRLYLVGGGNAFRPEPGSNERAARSSDSPEASFNTTYIYEPVSDTWSSGPNTSVPHSFTSGAVIGNNMFVVVGYTGTGNTDATERLSLGCPTSISGRVTYENTAAVRPVPFSHLRGAGVQTVSIFTDLTGNYSLTGFGAGAYTVTPLMANVLSNSSNGIFSNDAALIARHVVGLTTLNPVQSRAASVSGQSAPSSFDAGLIARWIVGLSSGNNQTGMWKFSPASRSYPSVTADQTDQNYLALLMGDVSGDWSAPIARPAPSTMRDMVFVSVPRQIRLEGGTEVSLPLRLDNLSAKEVSSYQFDVEYDPGVISPYKIAADLSGTLSEGFTVYSNVVQPGLLKVVVFGAVPASGDGVYVYLKFSVNGRIGSSSPVNIVNFRFNDGLDAVSIGNGYLAVSAP